MKKVVSLLISVLLILSIVGCDSKNENDVTTKAYYSSTDDVTLEKIEEMSTPVRMLEYKGGVEAEYIYQETGDDNLDNGKTYVRYLNDGDIIHVNQLADYPNGTFTHLYFSNDKNDSYLYMQSNGGTDKSPFSSEEINSIINEAIYGFGYMDAKLISVTEENGNYIAKVELSNNGNKESEISITIDPVSGYAVESETVYYADGKESSRQLIKINYSSAVLIDLSPKTGASDSITNTPSKASGKLSFSTVDLDGNPVTDEIIKNAKVVMVNYWEPWCGPCVEEMPDLEKLYEKYKEQGLLILGVFSSTDMDDDARQIIKDCNISYPVVRCDSNLEKFMTDYFPTTVFADAEGNIISDEPIIGANSYSDWEKMIESYLK